MAAVRYTPDMSTDIPTTKQGGAEPSAPPSAGLHMPGFQILGVLGQGAMGVVYKAIQTSLGRLVAIKTVLPGAGGHELERFQAEAEAIARLNHPHLVAVHEIRDLAPPGMPPAPILVMEYVGGGTLDGFLGIKPQEPGLAANLAATLADAMQHAHEAGIIHRDLKPANILLKAGEKKPWPKIGDFGLAKSMARPAELTISGSIMGTPGYMAPEQARGDRTVGPAADIHALGAILYRMLTGRAPYLGATTFHTIQQVLAEEPVPPRRLVSHIPADLETICLKCLEKDPRKRYVSCRELADDLRRYLANEPIHARPAGAIERGVKWVRRNPMFASLVLVSLLAVAAMLGSAWIHQRRLGAALAEVQRSDEESRQALVRLGVEQGFRALDEGRTGIALAWFAGTLHHDPDRQRARAHRIRYAAALRGMPELVGLWTANGPVHVAAFSPDGKRALIAGEDGLARIFDPVTGAAIGEPLGHPSSITHGVFHPKGVFLAGTSGQIVGHGPGGTVAVPAHKGAVTALQPLPGGRLLTAGEDGEARVWSAADGAAAQTWKHPAAVLAAEANADASLVATACADGKVRLYDVGTGAAKGELPHPGKVLALAWRPGGRQIATACADGGVRLWGPDGKAAFTRMHRGAVTHISFSADGSRLASTSDDHTAHVWDPATGYQLATVTHTAGVNGATFSPDGRLVLTWGDDNDARVWAAEGGEAVTPWLPHVGSVLAGAFHPSGLVLTAGGDHAARLWKPRPGQTAPPPLSPPWHQPDPPARWDGPAGLSLKRKGGHAATLLRGGENLAELRHGSPVLCAAFLADGSRVATGSDDNTARVWGTDGTMIGRAMTHHGPVRLTVFGHGGTLLATACAGPNVRVWVADAGLPLTPAWPLPAPPESLAFDETSLRVTLEGGKTLTFALDEAKESVEDLERRAALLSGCRATPLNGVTPLTPEQLAELWARRGR